MLFSFAREQTFSEARYCVKVGHQSGKQKKIEEKLRKGALSIVTLPGKTKQKIAKKIRRS